MQRIVPCLWFDGNAEDAANHYVAIFRNSRITHVTRCGDAGPGPKGSVLVATFELEGQQFMALNGGPQYKFSPAISLFVSCQAQAEVDELWAKLTADGGEEQPCGWLKDKFGVSWQIIPKSLMPMFDDPDPVRMKRVLAELFQMRKIDIARLEKAHRGG